MPNYDTLFGGIVGILVYRISGYYRIYQRIILPDLVLLIVINYRYSFGIMWKHLFCGLFTTVTTYLYDRPDDIHTLYSGKTVEINNTDAEGRLVLGTVRKM